MTNFEKYGFDLDAASRAFIARCKSKDCYRLCLQLQFLPEVVVVKECLKKWLQEKVKEENNEK